ncbi:hypothetical protein JAAARDRAFT_190982 [Jaapia argillacea MUCL 33604]|uniref:AB hydrolase-1 domain-containing protein n=1 Tax=Jaapia argillacea MUCL 33604 TaxID=933084 RepID=A0A067Q199_9AGAM|nr:hypothetical protein JAAARDRAFT_190982 [Jaapia argillacea MUCL 33604]
MGSVLSYMNPTTSSPTLHFSSKPVYLSVRSQSDSGQVESYTLRSLIESKCPSLLTEYRPAWWLKSGHLQTFYCVTGDFSKIDPVEYDRKLLRLMDGGTLGVDFTPPASERTLKDDTPIVVVMHGSHESYVRSILSPVCAQVEEGGLGYRGAVVNFRGCAGTPITSPQLYSAGHTDDLRQAVMYISKMYPNAPLIGIGFSLGANVLTRYLGQEGHRSRLAGGCALACPWDILKNSLRLEHNFFYRQVYSKALGRNLLRLMRSHLSEFSKYTPTSENVSSALSLLSTLPERPNLISFDDSVTRFIGGCSPPFPFASALDYYTWASSHTQLPHIRVPFLAISAEDDPIVGHIPIEEINGEDGKEGNGWVCIAVTKGGGHLGWFEDDGGVAGVKRWVRKPVMEWLKTVGEGVFLAKESEKGSIEAAGEIFVDNDGWIREVGREGLGCREIEGGGRVHGVEGEEGLLAGL